MRFLFESRWGFESGFVSRSLDSKIQNEVTKFYDSRILYYFSIIIGWSGVVSGFESGCGSWSLPHTNGFGYGFRRLQNMRILQIRIRNTCSKLFEKILNFRITFWKIIVVCDNKTCTMYISIKNNSILIKSKTIHY